MNANVPAALELSAEELAIFKQLADLDAAGVAQDKIRAIFRCTDDDLAEARQNEAYKEYHAAEVGRMQMQAQTIDRHWDDAEQTAVKQLNTLMEFNVDPRMALLVASKANAAARRTSNNPLANMQKKAHGPAVIDAGALAGPTRTVRIRTKFAEVLQTSQGVQQLVQREVEITQTDAGSLDEGMSPAKLKRLMQTSLGVDMEDVAIQHRSNPSDHGLSATLDFSQISADDLT